MQELYEALTSNASLALIAEALNINITKVQPPLVKVKDTADLMEAMIWLVSQGTNGLARVRSFLYKVMFPLFECGLQALRASRQKL